MNATEYAEWYTHFKGRLPSVNTWLGRLDSDVQQGVADQWRETLADVTLGDAKNATLEMVYERIAQPQQWERVAVVIAKRAKQFAFDRRKQSRPSGGQHPVGCLPCRDSGSVSCWHSKTIKLAKAAHEAGETWDGTSIGSTTMAVPCRCERGTSLRSWNKWGREHPGYDDIRDIRYEHGKSLAVNVAALLAVLAEDRQGVEWQAAPGGYESAITPQEF